MLAQPDSRRVCIASPQSAISFNVCISSGALSVRSLSCSHGVCKVTGLRAGMWYSHPSNAQAVGSWQLIHANFPNKFLRGLCGLQCFRKVRFVVDLSLYYQSWIGVSNVCGFLTALESCELHCALFWKYISERHHLAFHTWSISILRITQAFVLQIALKVSNLPNGFNVYSLEEHRDKYAVANSNCFTRDDWWLRIFHLQLLGRSYFF